MQELVKKLAEQTFIALSDPYDSVQRVYPFALDEAMKVNNPLYVGIKDQNLISESTLVKLHDSGFILHTVDRLAMGGRATDNRMVNPISGRRMTGSSSGTAINVRILINDLGIGIDGGGSVLMPALSLNLYGLISKIIAPEDIESATAEKSTDGIEFTPSIGMIARNLNVIKRACARLVFNDDKVEPVGDEHLIRVLVEDTIGTNITNVIGNAEVARGTFPGADDKRTDQIAFLIQALSKYDVLIAKEGPVDLLGTGDTIIGHMGQRASQIQSLGGKFLSKVVNMAGATGLVVPSKSLGEGTLLISKSTELGLRTVLSLADRLEPFTDELLDSYFGKLESYYPRGYGYPRY